MVHGYEHFTNLYDLLDCLTRAVDLIDPTVSHHHQQVAYIANKIAEKIRLSTDQKRTLIISALMHDIGSLALVDTLDLIEEEPLTINNHAFIGARLFSAYDKMVKVSNVIKYHHIPWRNGAGVTYNGESVSMLSHLIHLSDRIAIRINQHKSIISQMRPINEYIKRNSGTVFVPEFVEAFIEISDTEAFWLDFLNTTNLANITDIIPFSNLYFSLDESIELTEIFSHVIDFRSRFTAMHSAGVAAVAVRLAKLVGLSEYECKMMHIAGNLHDIGKLAIPKEILEKNGELEPYEYDIMKAHSYYTYKLLEPVSNFEVITHWAAFHHEKMNGQGYPFHIDEKGLSTGARIMAVADIFAAVSEDRPYRIGMPKEKVITVLTHMTDNGSLAPEITVMLFDNFDDITGIRKEAAERAVEEYGKIMSIPQ